MSKHVSYVLELVSGLSIVATPQLTAVGSRDPHLFGLHRRPWHSWSVLKALAYRKSGDEITVYSCEQVAKGR